MNENPYEPPKSLLVPPTSSSTTLPLWFQKLWVVLLALSAGVYVVALAIHGGPVTTPFSPTAVREVAIYSWITTVGLIASVPILCDDLLALVSVKRYYFSAAAVIIGWTLAYLAGVIGMTLP